MQEYHDRDQSWEIQFLCCMKIYLTKAVSNQAFQDITPFLVNQGNMTFLFVTETSTGVYRKEKQMGVCYKRAPLSVRNPCQLAPISLHSKLFISYFLNIDYSLIFCLYKLIPYVKFPKENIGLTWGVSYCVELSKEFELQNFIKSQSLPQKFKGIPPLKCCKHAWQE